MLPTTLAVEVVQHGTHGTPDDSQQSVPQLSVKPQQSLSLQRPLLVVYDPRTLRQ